MSNRTYKKNKNVPIYHRNDFLSMTESGRIIKIAFKKIEPFLKPGISTNKINDICHKIIIQNDATPAPLGYMNYPKSVCTSVNEVVCHGIPSNRVLKDGDILSLDISLSYKGWYTDACRTFVIGKCSDEVKKLIKMVKTTFEEAVKKCKPGNTLGDIGHAIQTFTESRGYSVIKEFCGHGIGKKLHEKPSILNFGRRGDGPTLQEGMFFTIEPMITKGNPKCKILSDGWSVVLTEKNYCAQFEETLGITKEGYIIFT